MRIAFTGEFAGQVGIALPVSQIRTLHGPVPTGRESAMGQRVREDVAQRLLQLAAAGKIPALADGIAPGSVLRPVPGGHAKFSVVAIGDRTPSCRERFLNNMWGVDLVDVRARQDVNRTTQGAIRVERIQDVPRVSIDGHNSNFGGRSLGTGLAE